MKGKKPALGVCGDTTVGVKELCRANSGRLSPSLLLICVVNGKATGGGTGGAGEKVCADGGAIGFDILLNRDVLICSNPAPNPISSGAPHPPLPLSVSILSFISAVISISRNLSFLGGNLSFTGSIPLSVQLAAVDAEGKLEEGIVVDRALSSPPTSKLKEEEEAEAEAERGPLPKAAAGDNARGGVGNSAEEAEKNKSVLLLELSAGDARAGVMTPRVAGVWGRPPSGTALEVDDECNCKGTFKEVFSWDGAVIVGGTNAGAGAGVEDGRDEEVQGRVGSTSPTGDGLGVNESNELCLEVPPPPCPCPCPCVCRCSLIFVGDKKRVRACARLGEKYSGGSSTGVGWGCNALGLAVAECGDTSSGVLRIWCTRFGGVVGIGRWSLGGDDNVVFGLCAGSDGGETEWREGMKDDDDDDDDDLKSVLNNFFCPAFDRCTMCA